MEEEDFAISLPMYHDTPTNTTLPPNCRHALPPGTHITAHVRHCVIEAEVVVDAEREHSAVLLDREAGVTTDGLTPISVGAMAASYRQLGEDITQFAGA